MKMDSIEASDEAVGVVLPVYVGGMPKMVRDFLVRADIRASYLFVVCTCESMPGVALDHAAAACRLNHSHV